MAAGLHGRSTGSYRPGKGLQMPIPQAVTSRSQRRQGSPAVDLAQLRRQMAEPTVSELHRQRLQVLADRLARVRTLGDGYDRVELSPHVQAVLAG